VTAKPDTTVLRVRVVPRARANVLTVEPSGTLRARLTAPPIDGAANRALVELLARALGLRRADFELLHGERGREKLIAVHGCSAADIAARLARLASGDVDKAGRRG
jgi:uncharacterized protein